MTKCYRLFSFPQKIIRLIYSCFYKISCHSKSYAAGCRRIAQSAVAIAFFIPLFYAGNTRIRRDIL